MILLKENVISKLDERDELNALDIAFQNSLDAVATDLAMVTHHSAEEWKTTIVTAVFSQIGHADYVA